MPFSIAAAAIPAVVGIGSALINKGQSPSASSFSPGQSTSLDTNQQLLENNLTSFLTSKGAQNLFPGYGGPVTTPLSALQSISLQDLMGASGGAAGAAATAGGVQSGAQGALNQVFNSTPQDLTGYFKTNVFDPLNQVFQGTTLPSIMSAFGGSEGGPQSTAAAKAVSDASTQFGQTLAATQGQLAQNQGNLNIQQKLQAAQQAPGVAASPIATLMQLLSGGGVPTQLGQQNVLQQMQQYLFGQNAQQQGIADLINAISGQNTRSNQTIVNPGQPSGFSNPAVGQTVGSSLQQLLQMMAPSGGVDNTSTFV